MKHVLIALSLALFIIVACTPQTPTQPATQPAASTAPTTTEPAAQPTTGKPVQATSPFESLPADVRLIIDKIPDKTSDGITYVYQKLEGTAASSDLASQASVYEKGSTTKLVLRDQTKYIKTTFIDTVILNTVAATASGYCHRATICGPELPEQRPAKYSDYTFPQPLTWLSGLSDVKSAGGESIDGRNTYLITATKDGAPISIWIDKFSGVPMQIKQGTKTYQYQRLALGVTEDELKP